MKNPYKTALKWFGPLALVACAYVVFAVAMLSCVSARAPKTTYKFKPGPAYLPGPKPYVHERYPNHP